MVRLSEQMGAGFFDSHRAVRNGCTELIESGGRGSGKSSFLSLELVLQLVKHPDCHAVVLRKVGATIRTSVYTQILWAVQTLGLGDKFRFSLSPLEGEFLQTGQKILFFGMDDPGKLKSIKMPKGYVGLVWFEELDQFEEEEVRSAEQSLFRGSGFSLSLKSFNPPADPAHWVNRMGEKPGRFRHHSTYRDLPEGWLGQRFLADAEHLKRVNPTLYDHEYLGLAVGTGDRVFPNVRLEKIDPTGFEHIVSGVDWGWWPDPWAFNRVRFHPASRMLYVFDEGHGHRLSNGETGALVRQKTAPEEPVIADSAEQKSVEDYRSMGIRCRGAKKGPGSLRYSMKWLQSLEAIVIDPEKCPHTAREFTAYAYENGDFPDRDNHHIDAVRYAAEQYWRAR